MWPRLDATRDPAGSVVTSIARARDIDGFGLDVTATLDWVLDAAHDTQCDSAPEAEVWQLLAATAAVDVGAARMLEPHVDALRILAEAERNGHREPLAPLGVDARSIWGVFAAEDPAGRLVARETSRGWVLTGRKAWCSLAGRLTHALVTAWLDDDRRALFAVRLGVPEVTAHRHPWHARGLSQVISAPVDFDRAPAIPIGGADWYLERRGFPIGGIGVAAAWWGGACGLLPALAESAGRASADQLARGYLGEADAALWAARSALHEAAALVEGDRESSARLLAARVRAVVARAAEDVIRIADHALGPAPLVADEAHARRVADLHLYLRQHHAERDLARLGRDLAAEGAPW